MPGGCPGVRVVPEWLGGGTPPRKDLHEAAHVQRLLQALLGLPAPVYRHHRLLLRSDGMRYAKRDTAETLRQIRAAGTTAQALREELGLG